MKLSNKEIDEFYLQIKKKWEFYLKKDGVSLPNLKNGDNYTKDALVLIYLFANINKIVTKTELTTFIQNFYPQTNDVQQARHLAAQKGWFILSGTRNDFEAKVRKLGSGDYLLVTLEDHYPNFTNLRRTFSLDGEAGWDELKKVYNYRCATCGSKEGEPNIHYPSTSTRLQKGHMDPSKPLKIGNIIPQCEKCNRPDRNYFVYDAKGRVIRIADPKFVLKSSNDVKKEMIKLLRQEL